MLPYFELGGFNAVVRSWACLSVPIIGAGTRGIWKFLEGLGRRLGKFWRPLVESIDRLDVVTCGVTRWLGRGCRAAWLGVGCSGQTVAQGAHVDVVVVLGLCGGLSAAFFMFWRQRGPWSVRHGEHRTLGFMCILLLVLALVITSLIFTSGIWDKLGVMRTCPVAVWISWFSPGTEPCLATRSYVS